MRVRGSRGRKKWKIREWEKGERKEEKAGKGKGEEGDSVEGRGYIEVHYVVWRSRGGKEVIGKRM